MTTHTSNFPYKTLLWVLFAALALFIFKSELKGLLSNAEELNIFGIEIKTGKEKAIKLKNKIANFEENITQLSSQITSQQSQIKALNNLRVQLEKDIANCPDAEEKTILFNAKVKQIFDNNKALKVQSDRLKDIKILRYNSNVLAKPVKN